MFPKFSLFFGIENTIKKKKEDKLVYIQSLLCYCAY